MIAPRIRNRSGKDGGSRLSAAVVFPVLFVCHSRAGGIQQQPLAPECPNQESIFTKKFPLTA
jgi:hypothetical protein